MSITDELRAYAGNFYLFCYKDVREKLDAIANRIDVEHERLMQEQPFTIDMVPMTDENMAEHGWVRLHKDTGGEYIHEHDKVDWRDHAGTWHENATVVAVCSDGCYVMDGTVFHVHKSDIRHHHAPTVEDVLTEFGIDWEYESDCEDRAALLREYAAKLRLAGDAAGPNELAMAYHVGYDDALAKRKPNANKVMQR